MKVRQAAASAWRGSQLCVRISVYVSSIIIVIISSLFLRFTVQINCKSFLIFHTDDGFIFPAEDKDPEDKPKKRRKRMKELPKEDSTDDGKVTAMKMKKIKK